MERRVVITGLGVVSPLGTDVEEYWKNLVSGVSGARALDAVCCSPIMGASELEQLPVCEADFDPEANGVPPRYRSEDRVVQLGIAAAAAAAEDAALATADPLRAGVALATAITGTQSMEEEYLAATDWCQRAMDRTKVSPHLYRAAMSNMTAQSVAAEYGLQGECTTLSTGCIGGLDAVAYGYERVRSGDLDLMVAGATEAPISPITLAAFDIIRCLSRNSVAELASRPFTESRDGFVLAEGSGIVVIESLDSAVSRGAPIYGELLGWDITSNATHMTQLANEGADLARALTNTLERAGLPAVAVDAMNAHGTSTPQNDRCETIAIKDALGAHAYAIPHNSAKSMQGHALAAASALEVVACCLSLRDQKVHPTINQTDPDPECDLDWVPERARDRPLERMLTDASGFSGLHAALAMARTSADAGGEVGWSA